MPLLNSASKLYVGQTPASAAYKNSVRVWPSNVNGITATLTPVEVAGATSPWYTLSTAVSGATPASYKFWSSTNGDGWVLRWTGGIGPHNFDTLYSSSFVMKVEAFSEANGAGFLLGTAISNTVSSPAAPVLYQQREWASVANQAASYNSSNNKRTDQAGIDYCFYGYYSSTHGIQKSLVTYPIPAEIRHCVSVDRVQVHWYNQHHFLNAGGTVSLVAHHGSALPAKFPGSTGPLLLPSGVQAIYSVGKPGEINGTSWFDIGHLHSAGRPTINEEIRVNGMQGLGLIAAESGQAGYGYALTNTQLHITYTVRL